MDKWWKNEAVYQVYPLSFCDSNGDGYGDIPGIISKLDYIKALGVGAIWLSPVYKSPMEDNGYDVSDYMDINPLFGTMDDKDALIAEAGKRGLKIIMDIVLNHTSDRHEWFRKALAGDRKYHDYYIWSRRPNNWGNFFGQEPWTKPEGMDEYYLHLFAKGQPDLNYRNPAVVREMENVMRFWLDKGVAGFRCDAVNFIWKDDLKNGRPRIVLTGLEKYLSRPGCQELLKRFRSDVWRDAFTVGETALVTPDNAEELCPQDGSELDEAFYFDHMNADCRVVKWFKRGSFEPERLFKELARWQEAPVWNAVYFENHDQPRSVSRWYGEGQYRERAAKAMCLLLLSLRGTPFIYQGEELGMTDFDFAGMEQIRDVETFSVAERLKKLGLPKGARWNLVKRTSRDNARTPMQWTAGKNAGFSEGEPWLGVNANRDEINAEAEQADGGSVLAFYRRMLALRNASPILREGTFTLKNIDGPLFYFEREFEGEKAKVLVNFSGERVYSGTHGEVVISNCRLREVFHGKLDPWEGLILR